MEHILFNTMAQFAVYFRVNNSDSMRYVTMDYPSESMALQILRQQGAIRPGDNVYIKKIERR